MPNAGFLMEGVARVCSGLQGFGKATVDDMQSVLVQSKLTGRDEGTSRPVGGAEEWFSMWCAMPDWLSMWC